MYDELELDKLGDRKTALFLIMSDTDATFNFLISMIYTQLFNLLCEKADDVYNGRLPVHVRCLIDECANIGQIPNLEKLIATIRSREISACLVLQAKSQLKAIYKDNADTIIGNCDAQIFLGGSEPTTLKDLNQSLGKETIDRYYARPASHRPVRLITEGKPLNGHDISENHRVAERNARYSIIERKPYADRTKRTEYPRRHTVRNEIRSVLDDLVRRKPKDWEEFLWLLAEEGYEIKHGKNIAIKGRAQQRFVRLSSLGEDYTEDALKEKISHANVRDSHRQTQQPGIDLLIDIQNRALGKGAGYERWAKGFNLKQTAKTLLFLQQHDIHSYDELEQMTNEAVTGADQLLASIKEKDARIKEIEALRQHVFDYSKTRKIYLEYKRLPKAKKAEFYELHRAEIELQEAARAAFDQLPEGTKLPTVKELNAERARLIQERQAEYAEYRKVKTDRTEFIRAKQNADVILNRQAAVRDDRQID